MGGVDGVGRIRDRGRGEGEGVGKKRGGVIKGEREIS